MAGHELVGAYAEVGANTKVRARFGAGHDLLAEEFANAFEETLHRAFELVLRVSGIETGDGEVAGQCLGELSKSVLYSHENGDCRGRSGRAA